MFFDEKTQIHLSKGIVVAFTDNLALFCFLPFGYATSILRFAILLVFDLELWPLSWLLQIGFELRFLLPFER